MSLKYTLIREGPFPNYFPSGILKFGNGNVLGIRYFRIFRVQEFSIPVRDYQIFGIPVHSKNLQKIKEFFFSYFLNFFFDTIFSGFLCIFGITVHFRDSCAFFVLRHLQFCTLFLSLCIVR